MSSHGTSQGPSKPAEAETSAFASSPATVSAVPGNAEVAESQVVESVPIPSGGPSADDPHRKLYDNVRKTLFALPERFRTPLHIADFRATDIFTLNSALGASIEDAVVRGLNALRDEWDPDGEYATYRFQRQAQAFPDVRLMTDVPNQPSALSSDEIGMVSQAPPILMGIELKGWFAVSKEGEPTFRYTITPDACAPADLLVVYPWVLSDVVAGTPKLLAPFVGEAKYAAERRNWSWRKKRAARGSDGTIIAALHREPYPAVKTAQCSDHAQSDSGGNFGRVARDGLLDDFVNATKRQEASGIPVEAWLTFFRVFSDNVRSLEDISPAVEGALKKFKIHPESEKAELVATFERLTAILKDGL